MANNGFTTSIQIQYSHPDEFGKFSDRVNLLLASALCRQNDYVLAANILDKLAEALCYELNPDYPTRLRCFEV